MTTSIKAMQLLLIGSIVLCLLLGFIGCSRKNTSSNVIRKAFVMSVNAGQEAEYEKRHRPIWPELEATLKNHGVVTYTIFLLPETRQLFGYVEFKDQAQWDDVAKTAICQKWWAHMKEVMPSNPDNSPVSTELHEVFHIEQ
jgi:L-rhamnose mutarotase